MIRQHQQHKSNNEPNWQSTDNQKPSEHIKQLTNKQQTIEASTPFLLGSVPGIIKRENATQQIMRNNTAQIF